MANLTASLMVSCFCLLSDIRWLRRTRWTRLDCLSCPTIISARCNFDLNCPQIITLCNLSRMYFCRVLLTQWRPLPTPLPRQAYLTVLMQRASGPDWRPSTYLSARSRTTAAYILYSFRAMLIRDTLLLPLPLPLCLSMSQKADACCDVQHPSLVFTLPTDRHALAHHHRPVGPDDHVFAPG